MDSKIVILEESWNRQLANEFTMEYFQKLQAFINDEKVNNRVVFPPEKKIFATFENTPFTKVKAVIIGQDPYHGEGQANGLCFSVAPGIRIPPSLKNIFKELNRDIGMDIPSSGDLSPWTNQGVLLLNATLTVRSNEAGSHQKKGWEDFTDAVIKTISDQRDHVVFLLWGNYAKQKGQIINREKHLVLEAAHPSPLARTGFSGCTHFSKANKYLVEQGIDPINWSL
jgi:uracil-DNA glycosylase